ncbi:MAG: TolC family protein, partial [Acidobacteriota bacterium]|nr:TolC family protein [Acidobacteriota bacterium]
ILRTLAEYAAAEARVRLEIANQYPNITLSPAYTFQEGFPAYTLGGALESLPILHRNQGPIAEAEAAREEVRARFLALQTQDLGEMETALRQYRSSVSAWNAVHDSMVAVQTEREDAAKRAFQAGESDRLDLTQARLAAIAADRALLDASQKAETALISLEDAVQSRLTMETKR